MKIRQPIVTIAGHVDHGKTSILDAFRESLVAEKEAGNITQKISFTIFPIENLKKVCPLIERNNLVLDIPGFLFIDTPGHAAFNNLRKRGGSLADLAILVIDINEGIKPQTAEVIQILKTNKVPFIIALNKIDKIKGWNKLSDDFKESLDKQSVNARQEFDNKFYTLLGALNSHGFESELFFKINDFTKQVAIVPCSAKTHEGLSEIVMVLCGLSQKFLKERLKIGERAKGVVLEIKTEKSVNYMESILYDGILKTGDEIAIATFDKPVKAKVKLIQEIQPLSAKFKAVSEVSAASGIRLQISEKENILPGMPFVNHLDKEGMEELSKSGCDRINTDKKGIVVKADSLGSLEAMMVLLREANIKIVRAGIGAISKSDILCAKANQEIDPVDSVVLGFNVSLEEGVESSNVKVITDEVVYKLIEKLQEFREEKSKEIERERLMGLVKIGKVEILHQYVFRNTSPAIFGVKVVGGKIISGMELIDESGESVGRIKNIQSENKSVQEAGAGMEVAISIPGTNFERKIKSKKNLYSNISEKQFKKFRENKDLLSGDEISVLQEIKQVKGFD